MAYHQIRSGYWGVGFTLNGWKEFVSLRGLKAGTKEAERTAKSRADDITALERVGKFNPAEEFPYARKMLKRHGLLPKAVTVIPTLGDYCDRLLANWPARDGKLTPAVLYDYGLVIKSHIKPYPVADLPLNEVTQAHILDLIETLEDETGRRRINYAILRLRTVYKSAVVNRLIAAGENPMLGIGALRIDRPPPDPFTAHEAAVILAVTEGWEHVFLTLLLRLGLRPNEALALRWPLVDFDKGILHVRGTLHRKAHGGVGPAKTRGSVRTLEMDAAVTSALKALFSPAARLRNAFVFATSKGTPQDLNNFRERRWKDILDAAGIGRYRVPYQCRHTFATLALEQGQYRNIREVASILGHTTIQTVMNDYVKPVRGIASPQLGAIIDGALSGQGIALEETA